MNDYKVLIDVLKIRSEYSRDGSFWNEAVANDIDRAIDAIEQLVRERDAAVEDLHGYCWCCTKVKEHCFPTNDEDCENWEWRGVQE